MNYRIRQSVFDELEDIWQYSLQTWGVEQADHYIRELMTRFQWLAENPHAGRPRDDIKPGYRCYPQGAHLIFYRIVENTVDILGVPHQGMDVDKRFE